MGEKGASRRTYAITEENQARIDMMAMLTTCGGRRVSKQQILNDAISCYYGLFVERMEASGLAESIGEAVRGMADRGEGEEGACPLRGPGEKGINQTANQTAMTIVATRKDDRVMLFIDLRNVMRGADQVTSMAIDHVRLDLFRMAQILAGPRLVVAAYVFDGGSAEKDSARSLHNKLSYLGFRVVVRGDGRPENADGRREQKEVDVALATELVAHALRDNYDAAVVVSGDRDFVPAIQQAQAAGKRVEAAAFNSNASGELKRVADAFTELDALPIMEMFPPDAEAGEEPAAEAAEAAEEEGA